MRFTRATAFVVGVSAFAVGACSDSTSINAGIISDSTVTADVAASSGEAIATSIFAMKGNEDNGGLASLSAPEMANEMASEVSPNLTYNRTRTCYNGDGAVVANCVPLSSVRKIVTHVEISGSRSGTASTEGGNTANWSGAVHRVANDTLVRNFNSAQPPAEVSRTHNDVAEAHDTTTFSDARLTRVASETAHDTVKAVVFNLPRASNPLPASGKIVRAVNVHVVATREQQTVTRDFTRLVEVTFPADAQGNVVLKINDKTCNLNLITRLVRNCQ